MERLPEDLSLSLVNEWLDIDEFSKLTTAGKKTNKYFKEVLDTGKVMHNEPVVFRRSFLKDKVLFTRLKVVVITESLIRYIRFLKDNLKEVTIYNRKYKGLKQLFYLVPEHKIRYDSYIPWYTKLDFPITRLEVKNWYYTEPDLENYLKKYGHLVTHASFPGYSQIVYMKNPDFLTLLMKYCTNLKSLNISKILKDNFYIESLEEVIGVLANNLQKLHLCTNIRRIRNCESRTIPNTLVNITSIIRCSIEVVPEFLMDKLEECIMYGEMEDYNELLNPNLIRVTLFTRLPTPEKLSRLPKLETVFIEEVVDDDGSRLDKLRKRFPRININYIIDNSPVDINVYENITDKDLMKDKIINDNKVILVIETPRFTFSEVYKKMLRIKYLYKLTINYSNGSTINPEQIKKIITSFPYLTQLIIEIKSEDYQEFRRIIDKYNNRNISFTAEIIDLEDEDIDRITKMATGRTEYVNHRNFELTKHIRELLGDKDEE